MIQDRVERFWSYVDKRGPNECWEWTRTVTHVGYGMFYWGVPRLRSAHRVAWELSTGADAGKLFVCHHCDNPRCCNPVHLFVGNHADNMADKMAKGREARGEMVKQSDLTDQKVISIRSEYVYGSRVFGVRALGKKYGVGKTAIHDIVKRKFWTHLCE